MTATIRCWGSSVSVDVPDEILSQLVAGLAPSTDVCVETAQVAGEPTLRSEVLPDRSEGRIFRDDELLWHGPSDDIARRMCSEVHLSIAARAPTEVFIHAGVVSWRGLAIVMPGRTRAGKTTLVRALLERGASYLSDEYAVLDSEGRVHPYAKPLGVRQGSRSQFVDPAGLGRVETEPIGVGLVIETWFETGAKRQWQHSVGAQVVIPLVDNAVSARIVPELVLDHTAAVARTGAVLLSGPRGEADDAAAAILDEVDSYLRAALDRHE